MSHLEIFSLKTTNNTVTLLNTFIFACKKQAVVLSGPWEHPQAFTSPLALPQPVLPHPWDAVSSGATAVPCPASCSGGLPELISHPALAIPISMEPVLSTAVWAGSPCPPLGTLPASAPLQACHGTSTAAFTSSSGYRKQSESGKCGLCYYPEKKITFSSLSSTRNPKQWWPVSFWTWTLLRWHPTGRTKRV